MSMLQDLIDWARPSSKKEDDGQVTLRLSQRTIRWERKHFWDEDELVMHIPEVVALREPLISIFKAGEGSRFAPPEVIGQMLKIKGVAEIWVRPYNLRIIKANLYPWDQVKTGVQDVLDAYLALPASSR